MFYCLINTFLPSNSLLELLKYSNSVENHLFMTIAPKRTYNKMYELTKF